MKNIYAKQSNRKPIIYAILLALILGIGLIAVQDIKIPTEHITQDINVQIED